MAWERSRKGNPAGSRREVDANAWVQNILRRTWSIPSFCREEKRKQFKSKCATQSQVCEA